MNADDPSDRQLHEPEREAYDFGFQHRAEVVADLFAELG